MGAGRARSRDIEDKEREDTREPLTWRRVGSAVGKMMGRKGCEPSNEDQRAENKKTNVDNLARLDCCSL
jgi:hypothetical protein